ncbi:lipase 1 [Cladorrhinum sp. PSN259]|nr:lipase 1 [Cladorrhinum sp. PSN259]
MTLVVSLLLLWNCLAAAVGASWQFTHNKHTSQADDPGTYLPLPSWDPWYKAPEGWEAATPGTVLKVRHHAYNLTRIPIANVQETFQVLFRSTNSLDNATWGVTTVFMPTKPRCSLNSTGSANCTQGILSYQLPYDTSCLDASPSFGLQWGEPYGEMAVALARGWWVSVPDFEGPLASYGANIVAGYITLDSVRAVVAAAKTEFGLQNTRVALWGYSNGASATEAAVESAAKYAPDLKIAGAAIGGLASNVGMSGQILTQTQVAGLLVQGIIGVTSQYPVQREYILSRLNPSGPYNATEFFWASYMSGWDSLLYFCYVDVYAYFIGGKSDLEAPGLVDMFLREGTMGAFGDPNTKLFMYQAVQDDMAPIKDMDALVQRLCDRGANILYHRNNWGGHNDELTNGRQRSFDFLGDVLDGSNVLSAPPSGCQTVNLTFMQPAGKPIV